MLRKNAPRRMDAPPAPSMFPHTITMYNVEIIHDKTTGRDKVINHITVLYGVLMDASKAANVRASGLTGADAVNLYIPFDVKAVDGADIEQEEPTQKKYAEPLEFYNTDDKNGIWTMTVKGDKTASVDGSCFFVKGIAVHPDLESDAIEMMYNEVYDISSIDKKDFGGLPHWEVGGV